MDVDTYDRVEDGDTLRGCRMLFVGHKSAMVGASIAVKASGRW